MKPLYGLVRWWDAEVGIGAIECDGVKYPARFTDVENSDVLYAGMKVEFILQQDHMTNSLRAKKIKVVP